MLRREKGGKEYVSLQQSVIIMYSQQFNVSQLFNHVHSSLHHKHNNLAHRIIFHVSERDGAGTRL